MTPLPYTHLPSLTYNKILTPLTDAHEAQRDAMDTRAWSDYQSTLEFARDLELNMHSLKQTCRAWHQMYTEAAREKAELREKVLKLESRLSFGRGRS